MSLLVNTTIDDIKRGCELGIVKDVDVQNALGNWQIKFSVKRVWADRSRISWFERTTNFQRYKSGNEIAVDLIKHGVSRKYLSKMINTWYL